jgi:thioredoxin-like negative regulator of GroEL
MESAVIERMTLLVLLAAAGVGAYYVLRLVHMRRMTAAFQVQPVRNESSPGHATPTLLYFRADSCAVCPAQSRYLDPVAEAWDGRVSIRRIDAEREPELAARYAVFSLPTTILVDAHGQVRHVNYGLTDAGKLGRQVTALVE